MPHVGGGGGDDLASSDEIKVFKDEGEEEKRSSENLTDLKSSLVTEGEEDKNDQLPVSHSFSGSKNVLSSRLQDAITTAATSGKGFEPVPHSTPIGYVVSPYPHPNGTIGPSSMAGKVPMAPSSHPASPLPFMMYNSDAFAQPPPAHMGIPPVHLNPKTGIPRAPMYPLPGPGQYPHPVFSTDFTQQFQWHTASMYPMTSAGFRGTYPTSLQVTTASLPRFGPPSLLHPHPGLPTHPGLHHPGLLSAGTKHGVSLPSVEGNRNFSTYIPEQKFSPVKYSESSNNRSTHSNVSHQREPEKNNHIKKPLNAFMLYMKEMRAKVVAECTLKESAAINQILGRKWHNLSREEQAKYYEMARKERQLHMQLYPGWSARDNYAMNKKKKKRKKDRSADGANNPKKCRARFGLDQQNHWCKPCRRKKKCIRYLDGADFEESEENLGSVSSMEAPTPDPKCTIESDQDGINTSSGLSSSVSGDISVKSELSKNSLVMSTSNMTQLRSTSSPRSSHHPLSVQHLTAPYYKKTYLSQEDCILSHPSVPVPPLPTPSSTDSTAPVTSTTTPPMLVVK
ncbi:transcription factor 7-like 2 isoform X2 [Tachypleus tridentatus]|uniref:transcription factor 7-like 2 isoform X2 n=1 Tax=Tachypleus tridentatus TaxID=6853 RepID=UPI003FD3B652